jgi:hypothetical protein
MTAHDTRAGTCGDDEEDEVALGAQNTHTLSQTHLATTWSQRRSRVTMVM